MNRKKRWRLCWKTQGKNIDFTTAIPSPYVRDATEGVRTATLHGGARMLSTTTSAMKKPPSAMKPLKFDSKPTVSYTSARRRQSGYVHDPTLMNTNYGPDESSNLQMTSFTARSPHINHEFEFEVTAPVLVTSRRLLRRRWKSSRKRRLPIITIRSRLRKQRVCAPVLSCIIKSSKNSHDINYGHATRYGIISTTAAAAESNSSKNKNETSTTAAAPLRAHHGEQETTNILIFQTAVKARRRSTHSR